MARQNGSLLQQGVPGQALARAQIGLPLFQAPGGGKASGAKLRMTDRLVQAYFSKMKIQGLAD
jgi:hypothetical protein